MDENPLKFVYILILFGVGIYIANATLGNNPESQVKSWVNGHLAEPDAEITDISQPTTYRMEACRVVTVRHRIARGNWEMLKYVVFFNRDGKAARGWSETEFLSRELFQIQNEEAITKLPHISELRAFCASNKFAPAALEMDDVGRL